MIGCICSLPHAAPAPVANDAAASAVSQIAQRITPRPVTLLRLARDMAAQDPHYCAFHGVAGIGIAIIFDRASQAFGRRLQTHTEVVHG